MPNPMTTNPSGLVEDDEEFAGAKGPYGGDPYFRGPLMSPLPQPYIKSRIYVNNQLPTQPPTNIQPTHINYILYIIIAIIISLGILALLFLK